MSVKCKKKGMIIILTKSELMELEKKYFNCLCDIAENHLGEILNQIASFNKSVTTATPGVRTNIFEKKLENIVEALITRQLGWHISSVAISSDSCYECGDAIIHVDAKTRCEKVWSKKKNNYIPNGDVTGNKIVAEKNETTYDSNNTLNYAMKPWKANLSHYVNHSVYGEVPNITYFFIMDYGLDNKILKLSLVCIPHGQFSDEFALDILGAGKATKATYRKSIRFLVNKITNKRNHEWREKILFIRK